MKNFAVKTVIMLMVFAASSCIETTLTNIVHKDGSVTRQVVIKNTDNNQFEFKDFAVPVDSTWAIKDTFEIGEKNDTTWIRNAEKTFRNTGEINLSYKCDSGANREFSREAGFRKKFHWFNTIYVYTESIEPALKYGYPVSDYLNTQELEYFYLPDNIAGDRANGPDSLHVKAVMDSAETASEKWMGMSLISEWKNEFSLQGEKDPDWKADKKVLDNKDSLLFLQLKKFSDDSTKNSSVDSVVFASLSEVFGSIFSEKYKTEIDSSLKIVEERMNKAYAFQGYELKTIMPGNLVATNGFINEKGEISWSIKMEHFLTCKYEMRAESRVSNTWSWWVSGIFVVFVGTGLIFRAYRKKRK
jgi:hypothetical protein